MPEGSFAPEVPRSIAPKAEVRSRAEVLSPDQIKARMQQVVGEIDQVRKNSPQAGKLLEQMQTVASSGEPHQGESASHQTLQELAKGNVSRVTKIDRFIYAAVERAQGDVAQAMQQLQESAANGTLYKVGENLIDSPTRLERVCKAAGVDYQAVQQQAAGYAGSLGETLTPDQLLAMQIVAFRDRLQAKLSNREEVQKAYDSMSRRMSNTKTQERYKELTGKELTIDNIISAPKNIQQEQKVHTKEEKLSAEIEGLYKDMNIKVDGKELLFEELIQMPDSALAEAILNSLQQEANPSRSLSARLDIIQQLRSRGSSLLADSKGADDDVYTKILKQQVRLIKLANAHEEALRRQEPQDNSFPAAT